MKIMHRAFYYSVVGMLRVYQRAFLRMRIWGREHASPGPKIYVANHITSTDAWWIPALLPGRVSLVAGQGYRSMWLRPFMRALGMINAMPEARKHTVDEAVQRLSEGASVLVFPEGDVNEPFRMGRFFPGFARAYLRTGRPIVPIGIAAPRVAMYEPGNMKIRVDDRTYRVVLQFRGAYMVNIGSPMQPATDPAADRRDREAAVVEAVRGRVESLVDELRVDKYWRE